MELNESHTQANLLVAYSGESQAAEKYTIYAECARRDGCQKAAALFDEAAHNERQHAKIWFRLLNGGLPDTPANLKDAVSGEHYEWSEMYPAFALAAEREGFAEAARLMREVAAIEKRHEARFQSVLDSLSSGHLQDGKGKTLWICRNCGYVFEGAAAPKNCPVCRYPQDCFERLRDDF